MLRRCLLLVLAPLTAALSACSLVPPEPTPAPNEREPYFSEALSTTVEMTVTGSTVEAEWGFGYWLDFDGEILDCVQRIVVSGTVTEGGFAGCADCAARLTFDPGTAVDISDPANDPLACDPRYLSDSGWRFAFEPLIAVADGGRGDLLDLGWYSPQAHASSGVDFVQSGGLNFDTLTAVNQNRGLLYSGALVSQATADSLLSAISVPSAGNPIEAGSDWYGWAFLGRDPAANDAESDEFRGPYLGQGFWLIQFAAPAPAE